MTPNTDAMRDAETAALVALAEHSIRSDIQELLVRGDGRGTVAPGALRKAVAAALSATPSDPLPDEGWRPIESAPRDGTPVKLRVVYEFEAIWGGGLLDSDENECGGWHALRGDIPPCWTDGICWESNEDCVPSAQPDAWSALTTSQSGEGL